MHNWDEIGLSYSSLLVLTKWRKKTQLLTKKTVAAKVAWDYAWCPIEVQFSQYI